MGMLREGGMEILWLGQPDCANHALVGGKVANLSRLAADFTVPPGFCIPTTAFTAADSRTMPSPLHNHIADAYARLAQLSGDPSPRVAVRSSAVDEDGDAASFAGQHDTYLNITGTDAVLDAVARCWESAHSERVYAYRRQQGLSLDEIQLAVLIQRLVPADVAAVVFSANPITGNRDEVFINASWGLGESIVGGTVTPDTYRVDKCTGVIRERRIAEKQRMTVAIPGGTREVDVPRILRSQPTLNDARTQQMAELAIALERTMGWPVDIECAWHGSTLSLLQCRPITTLSTTQPHAALILQGARAGTAIIGM